jgi:hypothetical protein
MRSYTVAVVGATGLVGRMMVKVLFYGYTVGIPSSRRIEKKTYEVLDSIPSKLNSAAVMKVLRIHRLYSRIEQEVQEVIDRVSAIARPKAMYRLSWVEEKGEDWVRLEGVNFTSKVMRKNLDTAERVFFYVATCGTEVESLAYSGDAMMAYCLDVVKMMLVGVANVHLADYLKKRFALTQTAHMNPGSLADWPLSEQRKLFSLLGDVERRIGVRLTDNCMMYPLKSTSGIIFPTEVRFESCQLCPREKCMGKRAPYSPGLIQEYMGK